VQRIRPWLVALVLMSLIMGTSGCSSKIQSLVQKTQSSDQPLIRVQIQFTDQKQTECYVKTLGLEKGASSYNGGASSNNMYDKDGNVVGSFNYQHVIYMSVLPEVGSSD
jgi:hypothetical protein